MQIKQYILFTSVPILDDHMVFLNDLLEREVFFDQESVKFRCQDRMNDLVISLAHKFTKLQVLSLRQIRPQLEDSGVEAVANHCHDLRELDLSRSFRLSDRSLYALAHGCPQLTRLNISGCSSFSDVALVFLSSQCGNLRCLNLCGCVRAASDRALQVLSFAAALVA